MNFRKLKLLALLAATSVAWANILSFNNGTAAMDTDCPHISGNQYGDVIEYLLYNQSNGVMMGLDRSQRTDLAKVFATVCLNLFESDYDIGPPEQTCTIIRRNDDQFYTQLRYEVTHPEDARTYFTNSERLPEPISEERYVAIEENLRRLLTALKSKGYLESFRNENDTEPYSHTLYDYYASEDDRERDDPFEGLDISMSGTVEQYLQQKNANEACIICMQNFSNQDSILELDCHHAFHENCLSTWLREKDTCPVCRNDLCGDEARQVNKWKT